MLQHLGEPVAGSDGSVVEPVAHWCCHRVYVSSLRHTRSQLPRGTYVNIHRHIFIYNLFIKCLQCFDAVSWAARRTSSL